MSSETISGPGDLEKLVETSLDCVDTRPDQGKTCEDDALMPTLAESGTSSPEQNASPDQKEEVKTSTESSFRKTFNNKCSQALVRNVHGPRTYIVWVSLLQMSLFESILCLCLLDCLFVSLFVTLSHLSLNCRCQHCFCD